MLREHRNFRDGFEERLQHRWGPALDLYECVRVCCLEAGEDFAKRGSQQANGSDPKLAALTLLHARACLVASEVQSLLRSGHAAGAQARWRTLLRAAELVAIATDPTLVPVSMPVRLPRQSLQSGQARGCPARPVPWMCPATPKW